MLLEVIVLPDASSLRIEASCTFGIHTSPMGVLTSGASSLSKQAYNNKVLEGAKV